MIRQLSLVCVFLGCLTANHVFAQSNRFALVIGNGNYQEGRLNNPANDAKLISQSLTELGFQVETKTDLDQQTMEETISSFSRRLPKNSFAFFFFAGHGVQAKRANYLIPIGATLSSESSLRYRTVPLDFVRDELENSKSNLNVVVLDCCRNNPFERSLNRSSGQRGFAPMSEVPEGNVIAFATGEGKTAADGEGTNSPYTRELANALATRPPEGLSLIEGVFFTLGRTLKTKVSQHPHLYVDSTMPKYYLWEPSADSGDQPAQPKIADVPNAMPVVPHPMPAQAENLPAENSPTEKIAVKSESGKTPKNANVEQTNDLLTQAYRYHSEGEFDYAVTAFGALINDPDVPRAVRDLARKGRGGSYLAKGTAAGINLAIIDFKAAKEPGIQMSVILKEVELYDAKVVTGKVHRNEILLLTQSNGDYFWVKSVQGNSSRKGWIKSDALLAAKSAPPIASVSVAKPSVVDNQPVPSVQASATPSSTSPLINGAASQASPAMISFDSNGNAIGVVPPRNNVAGSTSQQPRNSQPIAGQQFNGQQLNGQQLNGQQLNGQQLNGQPMVFDQNGNPIPQRNSVSANQPSVSRTLQSPTQGQMQGQPQGQTQALQFDQFGNPIATSRQQPKSVQQPSNNMVYYDQYGRQISQNNVTRQAQSNNGQFRSQQQQQMTQRQPKNTNSNVNRFSNSGGTSLKDLNSQRRDFDKEVSRYQWQNGPLSAAERREVNQWRQQNDRAKSKAFWGN